MEGITELEKYYFAKPEEIIQTGHWQSAKHLLLLDNCEVKYFT